MIIYLTFNDAPSGIYSSQVIDVVKFMRERTNNNVRLVAFISLRGFFGSRKKIKTELADALVIPMVPGIKRWRSNALTLKLLLLFNKPQLIIGRSVLATHLAFLCNKSRVVYDGRGAIAAEWNEYKVVTEAGMVAEIEALEKQAVQNSDYRIAVSEQLVKHWQARFDYKSDQHAVIPCTINKVFQEIGITEQSVSKARKNLGLSNSDLVFIYSGSVSGWQSFSLLYEFVKPVLLFNTNAKLLFISDKDKNIAKLESEFGNRILCKKVTPAQVPALLLAGDYGLLIREQSVTNRVASPVKFAEYLACGLRVILSESLGDYTEFVAANACGSVLGKTRNFVPVVLEEKLRIRQLALKNFTKENFIQDYRALVKLSETNN